MLCKIDLITFDSGFGYILYCQSDDNHFFKLYQMHYQADEPIKVFINDDIETEDFRRRDELEKAAYDDEVSKLSGSTSYEGVYLTNGFDEKYLKSQAKIDSDALINLGYHALTGHLADEKKAFKYFEQAADKHQDLIAIELVVNYLIKEKQAKKALKYVEIAKNKPARADYEEAIKERIANK